MRILLSCLLIAAAAGKTIAEEPPTPYPDLSEPKAAAFSLAVGLVTGDVDTVNSIYIGKDKDFFVLRDAIVSGKKGATRLAKAAKARFGRNAEVFILEGHGVITINVPKSLTLMIANGKVQEMGERAVLNNGTFVIELRKVDGKWRVIKFPSMPQMAVAIKTAGTVYQRVTEDIESGKCRKA